MKVLHLLLACFFSALWDDVAGFTIHQKREGTHFRIRWFFSSPKSLKFFCRRECKDGDVLVATEQNTSARGRYGTEYTNGTSAGGVLVVTIRNLTRSDSGRYRFGVGGPVAPESFRDFAIRVLGAQEEESNIHSAAKGASVGVVCHFFFSKGTRFFCRNSCKQGNVLVQTTADRALSGRYGVAYQRAGAKFMLRVTIANLSSSDSGTYACGLGEPASPASLQRFEVRVGDGESASCCERAEDDSPPRLTESPGPAASLLAPAAQGPRSGSQGSSPTSSEDVGSLPASPRAPPPAYFVPLVVCMPVVVVLLAVFLLFLYRLKTKKTPESRNMEVTLLAMTYEHDVSLRSHPDEFTVQEPESV